MTTAITIWQPHASLCALALKEYETRHWQTPYRGPIAIHAGKSEDTIMYLAHALKVLQEKKQKAEPGTFLRYLIDTIRESGRFGDTFTFSDFPLGAIVAYADLVTVIRTDGAKVSERERAFGDWSAGRYAWRFANVRYLEQPIPAAGKQGLWDWTPPGDRVAQVKPARKQLSMF